MTPSKIERAEGGHTEGPWQLNGSHVYGAEPDRILCAQVLSAKERHMADRSLIAAAPELLEALEQVRAIITEGALEGFNPNAGDWAERLFDSQAMSSRAVKKAGGDVQAKARVQP